MYEFKGKVKTVEETQTFSSGFSKRVIVLTEIKEKPSQYPNNVSFVLKKDNTSLADGLREGDTVKVSFTIDGRDWTDPKGITRHFVDLVALKLKKEGESADVPPPAEPPSDTAEPSSEVDDMPF